MFGDPRSVPEKTGEAVAMPPAIKSAETAMRIRDPNSARLNGERLAEMPVDAVPISLAVRAAVTEGLLRACCRSLSKLMEVIGSPAWIEGYKRFTGVSAKSMAT